MSRFQSEDWKWAYLEFSPTPDTDVFPDRSFGLVPRPLGTGGTGVKVQESIF